MLYFWENFSPDQAKFKGNHPNHIIPDGKYRAKPTPVGDFPDKALGLFDMYGNGWEWCLHHWHENYHGEPVDGSSWTVGGVHDYRVLWGGSWDSPSLNCRSAQRDKTSLTNRNYDQFIGFRVLTDT